MVQRRIIEHGSHRTAQSDAARRAFSYDGRIVGCKIIYVIFPIVVNSTLHGNGSGFAESESYGSVEASF